MTISFIITWSAVMIPLVFSPGPANVVFAVSGANFGLKKSLPLMLGVETIFILKSLLIGFGLGTIIKNNQETVQYFQLVGSFYLFYLAYSFLKPALGNEKKDIKVLGYVDGLILQFFNIKGWLMVVLMFSLFSNSIENTNETFTIFILAIMLAIINILTHLFWISSSSFISNKMFKKRNIKNEGIIFASCLFLVGVWFLVTAI